LVSIHEWGHLIFAKKAGMLAREFAIGFGPKIFSFTRNETLYTIRLIPAGGYVSVEGDDPEIIEIKPGHHIGLEFNESGKIAKINAIKTSDNIVLEVNKSNKEDNKVVKKKEKHAHVCQIEVERFDKDHD